MHGLIGTGGVIWCGNLGLRLSWAGLLQRWSLKFNHRACQLEMNECRWLGGNHQIGLEQEPGLSCCVVDLTLKLGIFLNAHRCDNAFVLSALLSVRFVGRVKGIYMWGEINKKWLQKWRGITFVRVLWVVRRSGKCHALDYYERASSFLVQWTNIRRAYLWQYLCTCCPT